VLIDARRGLEDDDRELIDFVLRGRRPGLREVVPVVVATKADKLPRSSAKAELARLASASGVAVTPFSAVSGEGRTDLWLRIRKAALGSTGQGFSGQGSTGDPGTDGASAPATAGA
jgi:GTP-binding protein